MRQRVIPVLLLSTLAVPLAASEILLPSQIFDNAVEVNAGALQYPAADNVVTEPIGIGSAVQQAIQPDGTVEIAAPGQFLAAKRGASFKAFEVPLLPFVAYKKATVDFDLYFDKWQTPLFHGVTALRRTGDRHTRVLYYGLILRGSNGFKSIIDIGKDARTGEGEILKSTSGPWRPRTNYHIRMDYDLVANRVTLTVLKGGQVVQTLAGGINSFDLSADGQRRVLLDFGQNGVADGAYFPLIGSRYSNLRATFSPR